MDIEKIMKGFNISAEVRTYGNGNINDTYSCEPSKYILQRINTFVFKDPDRLMENIDNVTAHLRKKIIAYGGDPLRETLTVISTCDGELCYKYDKDNVFRLYRFISDTKTVEDIDKSKVDIYNAGVGFGRFCRMLDDFPAEILHETIADFHNTPKRVADLYDSVDRNISGRAVEVAKELGYVKENEGIAGVVVDSIKAGRVPVRVTHNDTKINNILFDKNTGEPVCVIDLDTVMPGSVLYDFGDGLRICGSTAAEDEADLSKVHFDVDNFRLFAGGYLSETKDILTSAEIELLPISVRLVAFELGVRFLKDHIDGDIYFKSHRRNHNLDRARNQFRLCEELKEKEPQLKSILSELLREGTK